MHADASSVSLFDDSMNSIPAYAPNASSASMNSPHLIAKKEGHDMTHFLRVLRMGKSQAQLNACLSLCHFVKEEGHNEQVIIGGGVHALAGLFHLVSRICC